MTYLLTQADAVRLPLASASVDLVIGSPPYMAQRTYGVEGVARQCEEWVAWMLDVTAEALRVTRGAVIWVVAGCTKKRRYQPGPELLVADAWRRGWKMETPCYWRRFGIPGSGGPQWFRRDVEYCLCFKAVDKLPWSDNTARGLPPRWAPGGAMSHRLTDGARVNQWGGRATGASTRRPDGGRQEPGRPSHQYRVVGESRGYRPPTLANPGNLIDTGAAGGGNIGDKFAHENEAPFPEKLADFFIASLCPPGGLVVDPFSGSGTAIKVAERLGRVGVGFDLRRSQCELARRRLESTKPRRLFPWERTKVQEQEGA